jgi:CRP-like cAMP-binding protein
MQRFVLKIKNYFKKRPETIALPFDDILKSLSQDDRRLINSIWHKREFASNEPIYLIETPATVLYCIHSGSVGLFSNADFSPETRIKVANQGDFIGFSALIAEKSRTTGAIALEDSILYALFRQDFIWLYNSKPSIAVHLLLGISAKMQSELDDAYCRYMALIQQLAKSGIVI